MNGGRVLALTGGVGGAKLAVGLARLLDPAHLAFVVNTGDDFDHLGLRICPDLDSLTYALAGESNTDLGWGRQAESWQAMATIRELGGEAWFNLGDRDLGLHLVRRTLLAGGATLTAATAAITARFGIRHAVWPMSDDPVATVVRTAAGPLMFQHYFVRERCEPVVTGFDFAGIDQARPNPQVVGWLQRDGLAGVVICPSNPFVSVDPVLKVPGLLAAIRTAGVPVVAVSPIVGGIAIKGPAAKMMAELAMPATPLAVARHYGDLLDGFVIDQQDADQADAIAALGIRVRCEQSIMRTLDDRIALARATLDLLDDCRRSDTR